MLAKAKARPNIPLPMIALLRLKTDIPKDVVPGLCKKRELGKKGNKGKRQLNFKTWQL